jgi:hypothetical protein
MLKTFQLLITIFLFFVCAGLDSQKPALKSFQTEGEGLGQISPLEEDYRKIYAQKLLKEKPTQPAENPPSTPARAVISGLDDRITVRNMSVRLPAGTGWTVRLIPISTGGQLYEFERDLPIGNRVQIHIADYYGPIGATEF